MNYYFKKVWKTRENATAIGFILFFFSLLIPTSNVLRFIVLLCQGILGFYLFYVAGKEFYDLYIGNRSVLESLLPFTKVDLLKGWGYGIISYYLFWAFLEIATIHLPFWINYDRLPQSLLKEYGLKGLSKIYIEHPEIGPIHFVVSFVGNVFFLLLIYNVVNVVIKKWKKPPKIAVFIVLLVNGILQGINNLILKKKIINVSNPLNWSLIFENIFKTILYLTLVEVILILFLGFRLYKLYWSLDE